MDSRDFLFPLNRIVPLTSSSFLVDKAQPETAWHLLILATKEPFTDQQRSTLALNRETEDNFRPAIVGLNPFYQDQRNS